MRIRSNIFWDEADRSLLRIAFHPLDTCSTIVLYRAMGSSGGADPPLPTDRATYLQLPQAATGAGHLRIYLFYAGAEYERNRKIGDTFDNVRAAVAQILHEGLESVKPGK